ncbi:MAG: protein kinase, partial [Myxococcota bacterium]
MDKKSATTMAAIARSGLAPELLETLDAKVVRQEVELSRSARSTIRPPQPSALLELPSKGSWDNLPIISVGNHSDLELGELLGEGGMGRVQTARQHSLGRDVALKTIQPDKLSNHTVEALLREARLAGQLDHPNIVPVHALGRDTKHGPVIIMKRVGGLSWDAMLGAEERRDQAFLDRHLDIFQSVC